VGDLIFEKYEIRSRLAVGGMGEVFYAVQTQRGVRGFERPVILKSLLPDLATQDGFIDQFLDEARVAATLNHPNVVSIYEVGLWNGVYFIAMEYIRGRNIQQLMKASLKQGLKVPPSVIAHVIHDAALGLEHAHNASDSSGAPLNIVHRDISPQNIMVREDGVTKVVDFGIARASNRSTRTATGAVKGKLAYMAPEQLLSQPLTGATDQFALGVVLWEMCAGRRLFTAERDIDLIKKVLEEQIPHPSVMAPGLPEDLGDIALKMLERDVSKRFPTLADVGKELTGFLMKVSPPTNESPVKGYMKQLGTEDIKTANRATPSNQNFVISLAKGIAAGTPSAASEEEDVPLGSVVLTTPEPIRAMAARKDSPARRATWIGLGLALMVGVAGGVAFVSREKPVEPPVVTTPPKPIDPVTEPRPDPPTPPVPIVAPAPGKLMLTTVPPGANVRFDGRPFVTPVTLEASAGPHIFMIEKPGFKRVEFELPFEPGQEQSKEVKLEKLTSTARPTPTSTQPTPSGPAPSASPGYLTMDTTPWSAVYVSGKYFDKTPFFKHELPAGKHTLTLVNEKEGIKVTREVVIRPGETTKESVNLK
jgi:serine/threonine protein kinase